VLCPSKGRCAAGVTHGIAFLDFAELAREAIAWGADCPFDLQFTSPDGAEVDGSFLVMVSNNPYVLAVSPSTSQRLRLDTGRLGIFAVTAATGTVRDTVPLRHGIRWYRQ
jgi:hypothetical protein